MNLIDGDDDNVVSSISVCEMDILVQTVTNTAVYELASTTQPPALSTRASAFSIAALIAGRNQTSKDDEGRGIGCGSSCCLKSSRAQETNDDADHSKSNSTFLEEKTIELKDFQDKGNSLFIHQITQMQDNQEI